MSEAKYQLRMLRDFILKRGRRLQKWRPTLAVSNDYIDDVKQAIKLRVDEDRIIIREIDRMLKFKQSGRKKKSL